MTFPARPSCVICANGRRGEIDALLVTGIGVREVAKLFGVARSTLGDHRAARHHAAALRGALSGTESETLLLRLREAEDVAVVLAGKAAKQGNLRESIAALAEANRARDLLQRAMFDKPSACPACSVIDRQSSEEQERLLHELTVEAIGADKTLLAEALPQVDWRTLWEALKPRLSEQPALRSEMAEASAETLPRSFASRAAALAAFESEHQALREKFFPEPGPDNVVPFREGSGA